MQENSADGARGAAKLAQATPDRDKRARLIVLAGYVVGEMYGLEGTLVIGRGSAADIRIPGEGISRRHARLTIVAGGCELEDLGSTSGTFVNGERIQRTVLRAGDKLQLGAGTLLMFTYLDTIEEDFHRGQFDAAWRDPVTGIFNERFLLEHLRVAIAAQNESTLSLILFEIHHLESIRDAFGRSAADRVLAALASAVAPLLCTGELFARYGESGFLVVSRGTDELSVQALSEKIRVCIHTRGVEVAGGPARVGVSIGFTHVQHTEVATPEDLLARAAAALR